MHLREFMKDKMIEILLLVFFIFTVEIFLFVYNGPIWLSYYIGIGMISSYLIGVLLEFRKKKKFYDGIDKAIEKLDQKYLLAEMVKCPSFIEGKMVKQILQETGKSMTEKVNEYRNQQEEYREYIELWIHEVKTPIAVCKMMIENHRNEVADNMEEEIEKIDQSIEQALFYARSNHPEKDYIIKKANLKQMIEEVILKNKKQFIHQKITIDLHDLETDVYTDSKWLVFIINQIISNSIKYKSENPKFEIFSQKQKDKVILVIQDNGIGMKQKEVTKVFEKGFTGSNGRNGKQSTGIGLYLCKKLCDKLGQQIKLVSEEGKGTSVTIIFPENSFVTF